MRFKMNLQELHANIKSMSPKDQKVALSVLTKIGLDVTEPNAELTGTRVVGFVLDSKVHEADSHKDIFLQIDSIVLRKFPNDRDRIFEIKGRKRIYFSRSVKSFPHGYERIDGTDIYAGTNENAITLNQRCQKLLALYGIDPTSLIVLLAKL